MRGPVCAIVVLGLTLFGHLGMSEETDPFESNPAPVPAAPASPAPAAPARKPATRVARPAPEPPAAPSPASVPVAPAMAEPTRVRTRPVASGANSPIAWHGSWDHNCIARVLSIDIIEQPKHGALSIRDETGSIPAKNAAGMPTVAQCVGQTIMGKRVYYQSQPGFRGDDRVVLRVTIPKRSFETTIDIAVH